MGKVNRFVGIAEDITKRREAEEALRKSEEQFRLTFEMAPIGMAISNLKGQIPTGESGSSQCFGIL